MLILGLMLGSAACGVRGLNFVEDDRLQIVAPPDRAEVSTPVEIRWRFKADAQDQQTDEPAYALLVDRTPQPPGHDLRWFLDDPRDCPQDEPECPSWEYLATRGIYVTENNEFVLDAIAPRIGVARGREHIHDLVVILLDGHGHRIGETAARLTLRVTHQGGS